MRKSIQIIALAASLVSMQVWVPSTHAVLSGPYANQGFLDSDMNNWLAEYSGLGTRHYGDSMAGAGPTGDLIALNNGNSTGLTTSSFRFQGTGNYIVSFDYQLIGISDSYIAVGIPNENYELIWSPAAPWQHYSKTWSLDDSSFMVDAVAMGQYAVAGVRGLSISPVPIPGALVLFGSGLLGLVGVGRRRKN